LTEATFAVRTVHPSEQSSTEARSEATAFDLTPGLEQGRAVCNRFAEFLAGAPPEFHQRIPFLNKVDLDMQWAAASGGAAFFTFFSGGAPVEIGVLLSGASPEVDAQMLAALQRNVGQPILGERTSELLSGEERPLLLKLRMPGQPELAPTMELLSTALASVYFRAVAASAALDSMSGRTAG
jgi:hypothetical protein